MASLVVRNLDEGVKARLKIRAAENGHSMEAEAREILTRAVEDERPKYGLATWIRSRMVTDGFDLEIPPRSSETERPSPFAE